MNSFLPFRNTFFAESQKVYEATQAAGYPLFTLVATSDLDWNHDMAPPWDSHSHSKMRGADDYLRLLTGEIIPAAEKEVNEAAHWRGIAGYSLAGSYVLLFGG